LQLHIIQEQDERSKKSLLVDRAKKHNILTESFEAAVSLASSQYCVVQFVTGAAAGTATVQLPSGQGVLVCGVVQNTPAINEQAEVLMLGESKVVANAAFDAGVELTAAATTGKVEAASAADYVIGIALEAASAANHEVSALIIPPHQKNA
jgi:hypothetical protein